MADDTPTIPSEPSGEDPRRRWGKTGVGIGIGSAAIVAALLYANRPKPKRREGTNPQGSGTPES